MKLSIIIPAHNEGRYIEEILRRVSNINLNIKKEIVVIDDGSTDATSKILETLKEKYNLKLLRHEKNLGKGRAIRTALGVITGDLVIIQDADLEYPPEDMPKLLAAMNKKVVAVYGSRSARKWPKFGFHYVLGAKILTLMINVLYGAKLTDVYTGYKLFNLDKINVDLLKNLKSEGFEFEAEVTCKILQNKGKIVEVPINYNPRNKEEGKHIGFKDAVLGFFTILKCYIFS